MNMLEQLADGRSGVRLAFPPAFDVQESTEGYAQSTA